jgi:hypothetical protein
MSQDRFKGRVFQWIKGDLEGQAEFVTESKDGKVFFDSGNSIFIKEIREFMVEMGVPGLETLRIDPITGSTAVGDIPGLNTPIDAPAPVAEPQPIGEEAIILNLLEKQRKSSYIKFDRSISVPVPTPEAYDFLRSTFDSEVITSAIMKKAQKDIERELKEVADFIRFNLQSALELKYGNDGNVGIEETEKGVREVAQEVRPKGVQGVESGEDRTR